MSETFLERIVAATRAELAERRGRVPLAVLRARVAEAPAPRDFAAAVRPQRTGSARLIAEVKRASPSKGLLAETFDPVALACAYVAGGAAAVSVLTEPRFFLGALDHLTAVRAAVGVPVLRKDFVLDPYQVYEARAAGADAVLLLCALLEDGRLAELLALTRELGMEALVEGHDAEEAARAVAAGARVIGVNSRDLRTFTVDTDIVRLLRPLVPADRVFVAESGIGDALGAARARAWGADAILVGEALMRAPDPTLTARALASAPGGTTAALFAPAGRPFVKICGLTDPAHGRLMSALGADAFGLVFAPQAPDHRRVAPERARAVVEAVVEAARGTPPLTPPHCGGEGNPIRDGAEVSRARTTGNIANATSATSYPSAPSDPSAPRGVGARHAAPAGRAPLAIGVFVDETPERIAEIAQIVGLDALQLSGNETPEDCAALAARTGLPILKAVRPRVAADLAQLDAYALAGATPLLDTPAADVRYGGTGQTGDWALARAAATRWPMLLSGGLSPENVGAALEAVDPRGVDVSSGVETNRAKDADKIRRFIAAARDPNR